MTETMRERADRLARVAEYAEYGQRAGVRLSEHEVYEGSDFPRTGEAVRMLGAANVVGADGECRDAYVAAFAESYAAHWAGMASFDLEAEE